MSVYIMWKRGGKGKGRSTMCMPDVCCVCLVVMFSNKYCKMHGVNGLWFCFLWFEEVEVEKNIIL